MVTHFSLVHGEFLLPGRLMVRKAHCSMDCSIYAGLARWHHMWVSGQDVPCVPILRDSGSAACWQARLLALKASTTAQPFELAITAKALSGVKLTFASHFIPEDKP